MQFEFVQARNFRNFTEVSLTISAPTVVLRGPNAQGKTNLLEAIYLSATGRSFRSASPSELLRHDCQSGGVRARILRQSVRHEVEVTLAPNQRSIRVDGRALKQVANLLQLLNVVAFFPDDLRVVKGSPEERRRFLDRAVANYSGEFYAAALTYHRVLRSRNALLRLKSGFDPTLLAVYDEQLIASGEVVHRCRAATLTDLAPEAIARFAAILGQASTLGVRLQSGLPKFDATSPFAEQFKEALGASRAADRARGMTTVGPHRADLGLEVDGRDARTYASQGQQRAIVLALKLAEVARLRERLSTPPVLLLDDVSSELDAERCSLLFTEVALLKPQVWLSTTGSVHLPLQGDVQWVDVRGGSVSLASG